MGGLDTLVCSGTNCLSWILVLLSIFAVFYIVFFSFYKPSKTIRTFGLIYSGVMLLVMIVVLIFHVCLFTLLCSVFTIMLAMAILPVTMKAEANEKPDEKKDKKPKVKKDRGGFVITQVTTGGYVVSLYNQKGVCLATTKTVFPNIREAKKQILVYKEFGKDAPLENRTKALVGEIGFPKFKMYDKDDISYFNFSIDRNGPVFFSKAYESNKQCLKSAMQAQRAIESGKVFMSTAKLNLEQDKALEETRVKAIIAMREEIANRKPFKQIMAEKWSEFKEDLAERKKEKAKKRAERAEEKRLEREQLEREREEQRRIAAEEAERERLAEERRQQEIEEIQKLQLIKEEKQRLERERAERERAERERLALEKIEKQRLRQQRMDEEREERRRLKVLQDEENRLLKRRQELEKAEQEQIKKDKQMLARKEREKAIKENEVAQREAKKREKQETGSKKLVALEDHKEAKKEMSSKDALEVLLEQTKNPELIEKLEELDVDENDATRILDWSFEAKNNFYGEESQRKFYDIRNEFLSYGLNEDASWKERRFFRNGKTFAIVLYKGKIMNLYLALDPEKLKDSKYIFGKAENIEKFKQTPLRFRVASGRVVKWVFELIGIMMSENGFEKGVYVPPEFVLEQPQTVETLIKHGLIRETQSTTLLEEENPGAKTKQKPIEQPERLQLKRPVNMAAEPEKLIEIKPAKQSKKKATKKDKKKPVKKQSKKVEQKAEEVKKVEKKVQPKENKKTKKVVKKTAKEKPKKVAKKPAKK